MHLFQILLPRADKNGRPFEREDYDKLLDAALNGNLEGVIAVGHTAIYRNKLKVSPPTEVSN